MAQQSELHTQIGEMWDLYGKCLPEIRKAYEALPMEVYKNGGVKGTVIHT